MKKFVSFILVFAMVLSCTALSVSALTNDSAIAYQNVILYLRERGIYSPDTRLVDFDGDGNEELIVSWNDNWEVLYAGDKGGYRDWKYEIYSNDKMIASGTELVSYPVSICSKKGEENRLYFMRSGARMDFDDTRTYTIRNGEWVLEDNFIYMEDYSDGQGPGRRIEVNGVPATETEFFAAKDQYDDHVFFNDEKLDAFPYIEKTISTEIDGYKDVYSSLSSSEKKALFDDFLYDVAFCRSHFNTTVVSDKELVSLVSDLWMDTDFPGIKTQYSEKEFNEFTKKYFGRVIDYGLFEIYREPTGEDWGYDSVYHNGILYICQPQRGSDVSFASDLGKEPHLYQIDDVTYYATFKISGYEPDVWYDGVYGVIVKKNDDGSFRLADLDYIMTKEGLASAVNPSDWATKEIANAEKAGFVPKLYNDPLWKDGITRLQFAQLIVNFAEKMTGKTLPKADKNTFIDNNDDVVLKAYKAGIINGVNEEYFVPHQPLTRQQLATMIWRTVKYLEKESGKEILASGGDISGYEDATSVEPYAVEAVEALANHGIMKGLSETELAPFDGCSVEQGVVLVYRTAEKILGGK